jgi:hypothetical protein
MFNLEKDRWLGFILIFRFRVATLVQIAFRSLQYKPLVFLKTVTFLKYNFYIKEELCMGLM